MEPEVAVCIPRPDGVIEVRGSMQHPFSTRRFVAGLLGVPLSEIEIVGDPHGRRLRRQGRYRSAGVRTRRSGCTTYRTAGQDDVPPRLVHPRKLQASSVSCALHMGLTREGKITAVRCRIVADGGAYCSVTPWVTWRSTVQCCGPYDVPNVHCDTFGVYTNNPVTGAMRGFGSPQMNFVIDSMIEIAAERLGLPSLDIRRWNMVKQGSTTITGQKLDDHTVAMEQVLDAVVKEIGYEEKLKKSARGGGDAEEMYGIGLAISYRGVSLGAEGADFCAAMINVQADGSILIETGIHENGQGAESRDDPSCRAGTGGRCRTDPLPAVLHLGDSRQRDDCGIARDDHGRRCDRDGRALS